MKLLFKALCALIIWLSVSQYASACVGHSHTCNKDCASWPEGLYELCIWGAANPAASDSAHK